MAITKEFVTSFSELYYLEGAIGVTGKPADPASEAAGYTTVEGKTVVALMTKIKGVSSIGDLSNEATVIDVANFGEAFKNKLRGQLDGGQLDNVLHWAPDNTVHKDLRDLSQSGKAAIMMIAWRPFEGATDSESSFVIFDSFVSSFGIGTEFDAVGMVNMTTPVNGRLRFFNADNA